MKKRTGILAAVAAAMLMAGSAQAADATAGAIWYNFADTFISSARQCLNNIAKADGTISVSDADSQSDINAQNNNMNNFFTQGVDYLILNSLNLTGMSQEAQVCKAAGVTTIYANTSSPSDEDFENYEDLWFVSSETTQAGINMGNQLVEYFENHENWDRNGNGKVDFILLQGDTSFSATIDRSSYSLATIEAAGYELGKCIGGDDVTGVKGGDNITGVLCSWQRAKAQESVEALLASFGGDIDCILADNDDEGLGAVAALQAHGFQTDESNYIPVVSVDATVAGCEAVKNGTLLGTSLNNPVTLAKAVYKLMTLLNAGEEVTTESMDLDTVNVVGHRILIDVVPISADNLEDATYDINDTDF